MKPNTARNTKTKGKPSQQDEPIPLEEIFSLDGDEAPASLATPASPAMAEPIPIEEIFSLDADEAPAPSALAAGLADEEPIPVEEIFSLDADETPSAAPVADALPAEELIPVEEILPLDAEEIAVAEVVEPDEELVQPPKTASGKVATPGARSAEFPANPVALTAPSAPTGSGLSSPTIPKLRVKRPDVKITFVKPGEKSPFAK
jgi:hypothetical protein